MEPSSVALTWFAKHILWGTTQTWHNTNMTEDIMFKSLIKPKSVPLVYLAVKTGKNASIMNKKLNSCQKRECTHFDMPTYFI